MSKKTNLILSIFFSLFFLVGCSSPLQQANKTIFSLNEEARIDHFNIVLNDIIESAYFQDVKSEKGSYLTFEFKIKNNSNQDQIIRYEDSFQLVIEQDKYIDLNHNKDISIAPGESIMYQAIFDVPEQDSYNVLFYSGIVSNNIMFTTN